MTKARARRARAYSRSQASSSLGGSGMALRGRGTRHRRLLEAGGQDFRRRRVRLLRPPHAERSRSPHERRRSDEAGGLERQGRTGGDGGAPVAGEPPRHPAPEGPVRDRLRHPRVPRERSGDAIEQLAWPGRLDRRAVVGPVAFVGLLVPHGVRLLGYHRSRARLLAAPVLGALLLVAADLIGRNLLAPIDMPLGIATATIGAPCFLVLLGRSYFRRDRGAGA